MSFDFLPTNRDELRSKGWDNVDIILVTGDAYVDHPSYGVALLGRYLESHGYKVGIIPQPDWKSDKDFLALGRPNLFFGITSGNLDSMVANYTAEKRPRKKDDYSEGGVPGKRPDRAVVVYTNMVRKLFPGVPTVIGGIEASLRRITHYDYWSEGLRRSILLDSKADLLIYGMAEKAILEVADRLRHQAALSDISGTGYISKDLPADEYILLPSHEEVCADKQNYMESIISHEKELARKKPRTIVQACSNRYLVLTPPSTLDSDGLDTLSFLPFTRQEHPRYKQPIPGYDFVRHSVVSHRGCYGGCAFCSLNIHQGKHIVSRSQDSILREVREVICPQKDFKGYVLNIGGPTANMYGSTCSCQTECSRPSCLFPSPCPHLKHGQKQYLSLLKKAAAINGVKKVFVNSGLRHDLALLCPELISGVTAENVSGQLSLAPEHSEQSVLKLMRKPSFNAFTDFMEQYRAINKKLDKKQFVVPYFIASHPGCTLKDMYNLSKYLHENNMRVEQVQDYIPLPMTISGAMFYCSTDTTGRVIHIPMGRERHMQRALLQPHQEANHPLLKEALKLIGKEKDYSYLRG